MAQPVLFLYNICINRCVKVSCITFYYLIFERICLVANTGVRCLKSHADEARRLTNDVTYRVWRLYMSSSAHAFETGQNNIYQALLAKPEQGDSRLPLTRADWYV